MATIFVFYIWGTLAHLVNTTELATLVIPVSPYRAVKSHGTETRFRAHPIVGGARLGFLKLRNFNGVNNEEGQTVSPCEISWWWVKPLPRYGDFPIFQNGGRRHIGFLNFQKFYSQMGQRGQIAPNYQILWWSVKPQLRYGNFFDFSRWRPSAILHLWCACLDHHEEHLMVFITVQNLVGIDAVVLIICKF